MARPNVIQAELPQFRPEGGAHLRSCRCPRCRRWLDGAGLERAAEERLVRKDQQRRVKSLARQMALVAAERSTDRYLADERAHFSRLAEDARLDALLDLRRAGKTPADALAAVESVRSIVRRGC